MPPSNSVSRGPLTVKCHSKIFSLTRSKSSEQCIFWLKNIINAHFNFSTSRGKALKSVDLSFCISFISRKIRRTEGLFRLYCGFTLLMWRWCFTLQNVTSQTILILPHHHLLTPSKKKRRRIWTKTETWTRRIILLFWRAPFQNDKILQEVTVQ